VALACKKLPGSKHIVVETPTPQAWAQSRMEHACSHEFVTFVDDDDFIAEDSLKLSFDAIIGSGMGSSIVNETQVDIEGKIIRETTGIRRYELATIHPQVVHNLCVIRGALADPRALELHNKFGMGIDWFIRQSVVQRYGCIAVPIQGYFWTQHPTSMHNMEEYRTQLPLMSNAIRRTWPAKFQGNFEIWQLPGNLG
jgi:hypothetical protein